MSCALLPEATNELTYTAADSGTCSAALEWFSWDSLPDALIRVSARIS